MKDEDTKHEDSESGEDVWNYDFTESINCSYSYQAPLDGGASGIKASTPSNVAVMSDASPYSTGPDTPVTDLPDPEDVTLITDPDLIKKHISQNHTDGDFMNVLYVDSHVSGAQRPSVGKLEDNIFTAFGPFDDLADDDEYRGEAVEIVMNEHLETEDSFLCGPKPKP